MAMDSPTQPNGFALSEGLIEARKFPACWMVSDWVLIAMARCNNASECGSPEPGVIPEPRVTLINCR